MAQELTVCCGFRNEKTEKDYELEVKGLDAGLQYIFSMHRQDGAWALHVLRDDEVQDTITEEVWRRDGASARVAAASGMIAYEDDYTGFDGTWEDMMQGVQEKQVPLLVKYREEREV